VAAGCSEAASGRSRAAQLRIVAMKVWIRTVADVDFDEVRDLAPS